MKPEIEKILEIHKAGTITAAQAGDLLEEISSVKPEFEMPKSGTREKSMGELISDTISEAVKLKIADKMGRFSKEISGGAGPANRSLGSKIEAPEGRDFEFADNVFTGSHVQDVELQKSKFLRNEFMTSHFQRVKLESSTFSECSLINSHIKDVTGERAEIKNSKFQNSGIKKLKIDEESEWFEVELKASTVKDTQITRGSTLEKSLFTASSLNDLHFENTEFSGVEVHSSGINDTRFVDSSWMGVILKSIKINDTKFTRTHLTDVIFSVDQTGWKRLGLNDISFEDCHLKKIYFSNCYFNDVVFKNLTIENLQIKDLHLNDHVIDGNEAFLAAMQAKR